MLFFVFNNVEFYKLCSFILFVVIHMFVGNFFLFLCEFSQRCSVFDFEFSKGVESADDAAGIAVSRLLADVAAFAQQQQWSTVGDQLLACQRRREQHGRRGRRQRQHFSQEKDESAVRQEQFRENVR